MRAQSDPRSFTLLVAASLAVAALKLALLGPSRVADFAPGLGFDLLVLVCWWVPFALLALRVGARAWSLCVFALGLVALTGLVFAHTWFFDVAKERKLTVLDMTPGGTAYFFTGALPTPGRWAMFGFYALMVLLVIGLWRPVRALGVRARLACLLPVLVLGALACLSPRVLSPLFDSGHELWQLATRPAVTTSTRPSEPRSLALLDRHTTTRPVPPLRYKKVIVLVMETMTAESFERETAELSRSTFVHAEAAHIQRFERYFPNNQDSRTGMLDMLFSRLIPYEAYHDDTYERYRGLARVPSLVNQMAALSFATAFAVSQTALEEVVGELPWDATLHLSERDLERARREHMLCFEPDEFERSCEDLILLPAVLDFVSAHERAFVYQEFIWGHAAVYNEVSGKSNAAYYSSYIDALRSGLSARGLLDDTLIVLTSDHGFRDKGRQEQLAVYRMPLLFSAPDLRARVDTRLLSHSDFATLMFEQLSDSAPHAPDNELVMIVGPTGQGHLFVVGQKGGQLLLRHKAGRDVLLAEEGTLPLSPAALLRLFHDYRAGFDRELSKH